MNKFISGILLTASSLVITLAQNNSIPTAVFHGFGDDCDFPGMLYITDLISEKINSYAGCIQIGGIGTGSFDSIFENFEKQAENACNAILKDPNFQGEFNVIGFSQGGLIARYIVEKCPTNKPVRNMVTLGGPHRGVAASPHCFKGFFCDIINYIIKQLVYFEEIQEYIGPAGYFRDPNDLENFYKYSVFLPQVNNEKNTSNSIVERFSALNGAMLIMFSNDTMIYPKETAWFGELQKDGSILPANQTELYHSDLIGLKALDQAGKVKYVEFDGDHLQFSDEQLEQIVIPFLLS